MRHSETGPGGVQAWTLKPACYMRILQPEADTHSHSRGRERRRKNTVTEDTEDRGIRREHGENAILYIVRI